MPKRMTKTDGTDWARLSAMTDEEAEANAQSDPDNQPLSANATKRMRRMPRVAVIRRALGLTQEEFSTRYRIPLGTLRDWEQGRSEPDQPTRAYLRVIAVEPETTAKALAGKDAA
jgi:putative transcriptional regulator